MEHLNSTILETAARNDIYKNLCNFKCGLMDASGAPCANTAKTID